MLDVRSLAHTRETLAYAHGGLFPVLTIAPGGAVAGIVRGGAGHLGLGGRVEVIRSLDGGDTWSPPAVIADSAWDDRDYACGSTPAGTLIVAYHRTGCYDTAGNYRHERYRDSPAPPAEVRVTRSHDAGLTWAPPALLAVPALPVSNPYGKIVTLGDGTLALPLYGPPQPDLLGARFREVPADGYCSYLLRSRDDGVTWGDPSVIAVRASETGLIALPGGELLAALRGDPPAQRLLLARSADGGRTWSVPAPLTAPGRSGNFVALANGAVLLTYGNRAPPYRIEGRLSRDGGRTWLDLLLTFSGALYGYDLADSRPTDLGYPSSVVRREGTHGRGVTAYYNPALRQPGDWRQGERGALYESHGYCAVAVTWDEQELLDAVTARCGGDDA